MLAEQWTRRRSQTGHAGPLRVMFVVPTLRFGGAERHVTTLLPAMDRARFAPAVVCIGEGGELFAAMAAAGIPAQAFNRPKRQFLMVLAQLVREIRHVRPDVVITWGYNAETLGRIAAFLCGVPGSIVWIHNSQGLEQRRRIRFLLDRLLDLVTTGYFGIAGAQLQYLTDELRYPVSKIQIVPSGVDVAQFPFAPVEERHGRVAAALGIGPEAPVVGTLAVLRPEKDHATLLRAGRLVIDEFPNARIMIVGEGPMRLELERLAADLRIAGNVIFTGYRSDVSELLRVMHVFTLSSVTECMPMALLEAMASGRPAVCTAAGAVPDIIEEGITGHVVPIRDPEALAGRLIPLLHDPAQARAMGRAARARAESFFSLERSIRDTERAIEKAARGTVHRLRRKTAAKLCGQGMPETNGTPQLSAPPIRLSVVLDSADVGGAEILLLNLFRHLNPGRVRPKLVCLRKAGNLAEEFRSSGFQIEELRRSGRYDLKTLPRLIKSFRRDATDAVLVNHFSPAPLLLGRLAAHLARVPASILAVHSMDLVRNGMRCLPRYTVETMFISDALVLLAPSQGRYLHREEGVGRYPWRRIPEVVIPNGIPLPPMPTPEDRARARATLGLDPTDFVVGIVARLTALKAHHVLFKAIVRLVPSLPHIRLVVVGEGEHEQALKALVGELGIAGRTRFTGMRRDVAGLLPGFDVSCLSSEREVAPMAVIEAMAACVPIVSTDCGALRDMLEDGEQGFIVPVGDVAALADRIARLAADPDLRTRLGAQGRARAERDYRIEQTADRFERLLTSLVRK